MTSTIDPTKPIEGNPTTESVRLNFQAAKDEIEALQALASPLPDSPLLLGFQVKPTEWTGQLICGQTPLCAAVTTAAQTANILRVFPFIVPRDGNLASVAVEVTTGVAGNLNLGLYTPRSGAIWSPDARVNYSTGYDTSVAGWKTLTINQNYKAGQVLFLSLSQSVSVTFRSLAAANCLAFWPAPAGAGATGRNVGTTTYIHQTPPASLWGTMSTVAQANAPLIGLVM